ncbi:MAG: rod shape-determining protein MreD [Deltaproteobacteria bacterium]|nr:rod shape-determining protein MreD [Deltaproteobacteria bacterium]
MRALLVFALAGVLSVVAQTTLLERLSFLPAAPDLIVILCVYLGLHYHSVGGATGAFLLGYLLDTFSGSPPGLYCLAMTLVFAMVYLVSKRLWVENPVTAVAAVAVGCGVKITTVMAYFALAAPRNVAWLGLTRALLFEALFALVLSPLAFTALDSNLRRPRRKRAHAVD